MSPHLIVKHVSIRDVEDQLFDYLHICEVFPIEEALIGVSVGVREPEDVEERVFRRLLAAFPVYDLYDGVWHPTSAASS
ncbi:hypothetical protein DB347_25430 [Opitutaceae bacterium EW11]|nr:hypothetical protein DB347_25430 [Opitutaceae bacterium EW11]